MFYYSLCNLLLPLLVPVLYCLVQKLQQTMCTCNQPSQSVLSYLDDEGVPQSLEDTLNSKLTVSSNVSPASNNYNRKIVFGCDSVNDAYIFFYSNDSGYPRRKSRPTYQDNWDDEDDD